MKTSRMMLIGWLVIGVVVSMSPVRADYQREWCQVCIAGEEAPPPFNGRSVGCQQSPAAANTHPEGALSRQDKTLLTKLRQVVQQMDDRKASFQRFERQFPASQARTWQRLLPKVRPNSEEYAALSFALAYDGIDYDANLQRLLRPYRIWHTNTNAWVKEYPITDSPEKLTDLDRLPFLLNLLYLKHHDLKSLGLWLDLRLDVAAAEGNEESLGELWQRHANDMLRAASGSSSRLKQLANVLVSTPAESGDSQKARRALLADLQARTHASDPQVAAAARKVLLLVQKDSSP